jgi:hypothetical protein
MINPLS